MTPIVEALKAQRDDAEAALDVGCLTFEQFHFLQRLWSSQAFGPSPPRGPIGPLKHLVKEAGEALEAAEHLDRLARELAGATDEARRAELRLAIDAARLDLLGELVDCYFLVADPLWRAGFGLIDLRLGLGRKLLRNRARVWPPMPPDQAVEHDRSGDAAPPERR